MQPPTCFPLPADTEAIAAGEVLHRRNEVQTSVLHLHSGRVLRGVLEGDVLRHQLGAVEGPVWLDAASALLGLPLPVDMVADTPVLVRRLPIQALCDSLAQLPAGARGLLLDMARGHRQQCELAVSRLAQDAESRCAQWLLQHAEPGHGDGGALQVRLHLRKRLIAAQLGIAPETFSRVLRHLRDRGLVHGTGNVLNLPQPRALQSMAGC
ncbi:MAG: Crp/Fnr family transcriptional regulator [Acidovorax sp.]|uniref:Crp/Fnr family transcriptional regulator n=1 Tax=Acidovorax sp. TaxID=1872122 RepID=UPI0039E3044E